MHLYSPAKLNLNLEVKTEVRDGLHTLESLFIPIDLCDEIEINESGNNVDEITFTPEIELTGKSTIEKSLDLLREENNFSKHFLINVTKNIPTESGLGGGSSNAGTILNYLSSEYNLNLPSNDLIAKYIGSDVPFFILGKPAIVGGLGEIVEENNDIGDLDILLAVPHENISTSLAYKKFDELGQKNDYEKIKINNLELFNNMWNPAVGIEPTIAEHKKHLEEVLENKFFMSGTGSTLFCLGEKNDLVNRLEGIDKTRFRLLTITKKIDSSFSHNAG